MKKVYMIPSLAIAQKDYTTSINQIILRLKDKLPNFGWAITANRDEADIVAAHAGQTFGEDDNIDVAHCHGLYPTAKQGASKAHFGINRNVIKHIFNARAVTVPSQWVADTLRREMNIDPYVVNWGIKRIEWRDDTPNKQYALWNKTRASFVCDPMPVLELAQAYPDNRFVMTFTGQTNPPDNVDVIGRRKFDEMKRFIKECGVYISTTKETFGIGTLEALAAGKPVLGFNWGAIPEFVEHGYNGFLAEPNDIEGLIKGLHWIWLNYQDLSKNARKTAIDNHYTWERVAQDFANIYDKVLEQKQSTPLFEVSVIIPSHNYAEYLPHAIHSVMNQETNFLFDITVVDDASTDNTKDVVTSLRHTYKDNNVLFKYIRHESNTGVAITRNDGAKATDSKYLVFLDADDRLGTPHFLQSLYNFLEKNESVGIAYTGMGVFVNGQDRFKVSDFPPNFSMKKQLEGKNQIPTCNMMRRKAFERAGGYRSYQQPSEDAALWTSILCLGWQAKKVTDKPLFLYRFHNNSLSHSVRVGRDIEPYWRRQWHTTIAEKAYIASVQIPDNGISHPVFDYDKPMISVIIPVGKGHEIDLIRALDSVQSQTFINWECIVVNDTGAKIDCPHNWVKHVSTRGNKGAGYARNEGLKIAKGDFVVFLDADDMLLPDFMSMALSAFKRTGRYIYTSWYGQRGRLLQETTAQEYTQSAILRQSSIHAITCLIPRIWAQEIGFDENLPAWEDSDFFMRMAIKGYCGHWLQHSLFVYNYDSGKRREFGVKHKPKLVDEIRKKHGDYILGDKKMCGCKNLFERKTIDLSSAIESGDMIRVEMVTGASAKVQVRGAITNQNYGRRQNGDVFYMFKEDVEAQSKQFKPIAEINLRLNKTEMPQGG